MLRKQDKTTRLTWHDIIFPKDTGETLEDLRKRLRGKNPASASQAANATKPTGLRRKAIKVAEKAFQWRRFGRNNLPRQEHILGMAKAVRDTTEPLPAILVLPVGRAFYVIDGHHRLAAYDTAGWTREIPAYVFEGALDDAQIEALKR